MTMERWSPFAELRRMDDMMNRLWRGYGANGAETAETWGIPLDVIREGDNIVVQATIPGVDPRNIDVTVEENVLTIKAQTSEEKETQQGEYLLKERRTGSFHRAIRLPDTVDQERAETRFKDGVLTITFPKQESKKARRLNVA